MKGQVRRSDDQGPLDEPTDFELLDEKPRHDGLAGARVVRQQEANPWEPEKIVVDGFELVRKGIYTGDGESKVGIVLISET